MDIKQMKYLIQQQIWLESCTTMNKFCNNPQVAAKNAVLDPIKVIINETLPLDSKIGV